MTAPGYWMHETGGELRKAMQAYLLGEPLSARQINLIRAYLRQWIAAPGWAPGPGLDELRARIDGLTSTAAIHRWLDDAGEYGIDPL